MADRDGGPFALGRFWGYRTSQIGCAYDLCYNAWDADARAKVEDYLDWILFKCLHRQHRVGTVNWAPGSNYTVVIHAGNGLAALALGGEKGPAPVEPLAPRTEAPRIPPAVHSFPAGVPVVKLEPGKTPTEWLWIGPFESRVLQHEHPYFAYQDPVDCLAAMGGMAKARPETGTKVSFRKQTLEWKPLSIKTDPRFFEPDNGDKSRTVLNTSRLSDRRENTRLFFHTVVENEKPGWYQVQAPFYEGGCFLNGVRLAHGDFAFLEKGRFPLLVPVAMGDGEYTATIQFREAAEAEAKGYYSNPARFQAYEAAKKTYEGELARWKAGGGANLAWEGEARALQHWNYLNLRLGMGDGGFQGEGEGYTLECHHVLHDYACAYQNVFGKSITGQPDISHFAARYVMTTVWEKGEGGRPQRPFSQSFGGHGGGTISARYLGRSIALCPKEWKPALLWYWLRSMGVSADEVETEAGAKKAFGGAEYRDGLALVEAFLHYPLDMMPRNPGELLPRGWEARTRGFYCFRNGWEGPDDIVAQVYARQGKPCGWSQAEAGCFQIYGLGREWAWKDNNAGGKTGSRWLDNVVMLPDDPVNAWGQGKVTYFRRDDRSGSGTVTIDMEDVYRFLRPIEGKKGATEKYDGGVRGLRSFAVDYSGRAGVPGLFAVVDKISGGKKKIWIWQLPRSPKVECTIEENSFTIRDGDASLKATFIGPKSVKILKADGKFEANRLSGVDTVPSRAIHVTGADDQTSDFFVILTLQRGAAPAVEAEGNGLDAVVTVGGQTVRFDGKNIVLGK